MGLFSRRKDESTTADASPSPAVDGDWMRVGAPVTHSKFGTGEVVQVDDYKGVPTVWIAFDRGMVKALDIQYAGPHVRHRLPSEPQTPADPNEKCDVCGARPVAVSIQGDGGLQRFCLDHKANYRP